MSKFKSKKFICLLGFVLFLILALFKFTLAQSYPPEFCSSYASPEECGTDPNCEWKNGKCVPRGQGGETEKPSGGGGCACGWNLICWAGCIFRGIIAIPLLIIVPVVIIFSMMMAIFGMILTEIAQSIVQAIIASSLTLSVTALGGGKIFELWVVVRDIALWFFAVFLALIGLATIFRIESYWAKKALVPLLIIALLFNFIPFIVRTIVSIGNSLSCWMISKLGTVCGGKITLGCTGGGGAREVKLDFFQNETGDLTQTFIGFMSGYFNNAWSFLLSLGTESGQFIADSAMLMAAAIIYVVFWFAFAFILFAFGLSFLLRMVFIWLLFLASPIAFATFALRTREIKAAFPGPLNWEGWIEEILKWSFIGVLMSFWIGIAACLIQINPLQDVSISLTKFGFGENYKNYVTDAFATSAKYIAAIVALYLGFKAAPELIQGFAKGMTTAAVAIGTIVATAGLSAGASVVGGLAKGVGGVARRAGGWIGKRSPRLARVAERATAFERGARRFAERMETYVPMRATLEETLKGVPFAGPVMERMAAVRKAEKERLEEAEKRYKEWAEKGRFDRLKEEALSSLIPLGQRVKALEVLAEKGKIDEEVVRSVFAGKTLDEIRRDYGSKVTDALRIQRPDLLRYVINPKTNSQFTEQQIQEEILPRLTTKNVLEMAPEALRKDYVAGWIANRQNLARQLVRSGNESQKMALYEGFFEYFERETKIPVFTEYQKNRTERSLPPREAAVESLLSQRKSIQEKLGELKQSEDIRKKVRGEAYERMLNSILLQI